MSERADVVVIGGGILGLATARELLARRPGATLVLVEKEQRLAAHQTSHNSGVVHAGIYYAPGSLKARLCRAGMTAMEEYAVSRGVAYRRSGKLVVATSPDQRAALERLHDRALANGVPGVEMLGPAGLRDREPHVSGVAALWSPATGVVDFHGVALAMAEDLRRSGAEIVTGTKVTAVTPARGRASVVAGDRSFDAGLVIACAGLHADSVASLSGDAGDERIVPFRGDYYTLTREAAPLVRGLVYPVPDPRFPFLGIHLTRTVDDRVLAGPNAVLALAREGYRRRDVHLGDVAASMRSRGLWRLAARHWRTGLAEVWRDVSRAAFAREVQRFVPAIEARHLRFGPSGVRAQAVDPDGTLVEDFRIGGSGPVVHVRNAPSPAATASLAIAAHLADIAQQRLHRRA